MVSAALVALAVAGAPVPSPSPRRLDLSRRIALPSTPSPEPAAQSPRLLRVAFATMVSPPETWTSYGRLAGYLAARMGARPEIVQRGSYGDVNRLLVSNSIALAFICSGAYPEAHDRFGARLVAAPVIGGRAAYRSYVLVPAAWPGSSLAELVRPRIAWVDPLSLTGRLHLLARLHELGLPVPPEPGQAGFTHSHDRSVRLVARGLADLASVDSLVWDWMKRTEPATVGATRILERSAYFPSPPFVVPASCSTQLETGMKAALVSMHADPAGQAILAALGIERFEPIGDTAYETVRELQRRVAGLNGSSKAWGGK